MVYKKFLPWQMLVFVLLCFFILCLNFYAIAMKKNHLPKSHAIQNFFNNPNEIFINKISRKKKKPIFVIQKHDASHTHFDLRLEIGGVLVSWAIPKGPSLDPKKKRLAIRTENHPLEYAQFEGVIPKDNYGAGTVMIWDTGTFEPYISSHKKTPALKTQLKKGHIKIVFSGSIIQGAFTLIRTHNDQWLLIKMGDKYASCTNNPSKKIVYSAVTHRTMDQIKKNT